MMTDGPTVGVHEDEETAMRSHLSEALKSDFCWQVLDKHRATGRVRREARSR